jgi:hypothetical protein
MEKEFVPYEQALILRELGFDEPCFGYYTGDKMHLVIRPAMSRTNIPDSYVVTAPLYQQAFRWFENTYGLFVDRNTMCSINEVMSMGYYIRSINGTWLVLFPADYSEFDPYKANTTCIEKLIEIVKNGKITHSNII